MRKLTFLKKLLIYFFLTNQANESLLSIPRRFVFGLHTVRESPLADCLDPSNGLKPQDCVQLLFLSEFRNPSSWWQPFFRTIKKKTQQGKLALKLFILF